MKISAYSNPVSNVSTILITALLVIIRYWLVEPMAKITPCLSKTKLVRTVKVKPLKGIWT